MERLSVCKRASRLNSDRKVRRLILRFAQNDKANLGGFPASGEVGRNDIMPACNLLRHTDVYLP